MIFLALKRMSGTETKMLASCAVHFVGNMDFLSVLDTDCCTWCIIPYLNIVAHVCVYYSMYNLSGAGPRAKCD